MNETLDGSPVDPDVAPQEIADCKHWLTQIRNARKYDEDARKQMAIDRRDARGDTKAEVSSNLIGTFIDISASFLVAKNPACDVLPAKSTEPPSQDAIREVAEAQPLPPELQQQVMVATQTALAVGGPEAAAMAQQQATVAAQDMHAQAMFDQIQRRFQKRQRDNKSFAETLELVIERMWMDARLKFSAKRWVTSALTVATGVMKASWQERTAPDPEVLRQVNDLQDNLKRVAMLRQEIAEDGAGDEADAKKAEYERQLAALQGNVERVVARGFVIDFVPAEQIQVAPGVDICRYQDAPWIAQQIPMLKEDAKAEFQLSDDKIKAATSYQVRKPEMGLHCDAPMSPSLVSPITPDYADSYTSSYVGGSRTDAMASDDVGTYLMVWEIWDRGSNTVLTAIEGVQGWVKPAWQPCATTRFFPFFLFTISDVDGQRWPQSLVSRSNKLMAEYNRIGSQESIHRKRTIPKSVFDSSNLEKADADKIAAGTTGEMIGVKPLVPGSPVQSMVLPIAYPPLDPYLYDRQRILAELERIWGIQEALAGSVTVDKTATEAEIQQGGFQARMGGRRDAMEDSFTELALYTAEIARCYMTTEDVVAIVGPDAMWPQYDGAESLREFVNVEIRAGSSGKPNTSAERNSWSALLPLLQGMQTQVAQLRNADPAELADCIVKLAQMTAEKFGERMDTDSLFPQAGPPLLPQPGEGNGSDGTAGTAAGQPATA